MFEAGTIIYFDPFYFKNANTAKPKYFLILKNIQDKIVLASLPTRKDYIPKADIKENGCIELPEYDFNCFVISNKTEVTECGKHFDFNTFLYGHQIDDYSVEELNNIYPIKDTDYYNWGKMKNDLFNSLIECFSKSKSVKRKYSRMLSA